MGIFGTLSTSNTLLNGLVLDAASNNTQTLTWGPGSPGVINSSVNINISEPAVLNLECCEVDFSYCLNVSIKDVDCNVCDTSLCTSREPDTCDLAVNYSTEDICVGEELSITWSGQSYNESVNVTLVPMAGGGAIDVVSNQSDNGTTIFTIPNIANICDQFYRIDVTDINNPTECYVRGDSFLIECCDTCDLSIDPTDTVYCSNETNYFNFNGSTSSGMVTVQVYTGGPPTWTMSSSQNWNINTPFNISGFNNQSVMLIIIDPDNTDCRDTSEVMLFEDCEDICDCSNISISGLPATFCPNERLDFNLNVCPKEGRTFSVKLHQVTGGSAVFPLMSGPFNSGSHGGGFTTVLSQVDCDEDYRLVVTMSDDPECRYESSIFKVKCCDTSSPVDTCDLEITSSVDDSYCVGNTMTISWSGGINGQTMVDLIHSSGLLIAQITNTANGSGTINYTLPTLSSEMCGDKFYIVVYDYYAERTCVDRTANFIINCCDTCDLNITTQVPDSICTNGNLSITWSGGIDDQTIILLKTASGQLIDIIAIGEDASGTMNYTIPDLNANPKLSKYCGTSFYIQVLDTLDPECNDKTKEFKINCCPCECGDWESTTVKIERKYRLNLPGGKIPLIKPNTDSTSQQTSSNGKKSAKRSRIPSLTNPVETVSCEGTFEGKIRATYEFTAPNYLCNPEDCEAEYSYQIYYKPKGAADWMGIKGGIGKTFSHTFDLKGTYKIVITPKCGGKDCKPCEFYINI
jgi:hypothetical protein